MNRDGSLKGKEEYMSPIVGEGVGSASLLMYPSMEGSALA